MRSSLKISTMLLVNFSILSTEVFAYLPEITFESPTYQPLHIISHTSPDGWQSIYGDASITAAGQGYGGAGQALKIAADPSEGTLLRKPITWNPSESIAFIDFRIKPSADPEGSLANFFANGTQIAFQIPDHTTTGELWVLDGNDPSSQNPPPLQEQWYKAPATFNVPAGPQSQSVDWIRVTLRHDYGRDLWDLFVDGKLAAVNLGFDGRGGNLQSLDFFGSTAGDTLIDNLSAKTSNMLYADADKDGLPDAWETANGSNPNLYDRDQGVGETYLERYLESLWNEPQSPGQAVSGSLATGGSAIGSIGTIPPQTLTGSHQPVGAVKGTLNVGNDGSATYSIPIDVPKGTAGMEPKISLNYSSNGGNGIAGLGWSLGGLQQIVRGGSTYHKDSVVDGVDYDPLDRFFLDGERLICVEGEYGKAGSVYRTEMDSYARITAIDSEYPLDVNKPDWIPGPKSWKIETKAGLTVLLGSRPEANSKVTTALGPLTWCVDKVQDTHGNYYLADYAVDNGAMSNEVRNLRVSEIKYTGTSSRPAFASIAFNYANRQDKRVTYNAGVRNYFDQRLSSVVVKTGGHENYRLNLGYKVSHQTGRSLLESVTKVGEGGALQPTVFEWKTLDHHEDRWKEDVKTDVIVEYGSNLDSRDGLAGMISPMPGATNHVHLTGVVWRAIPLTHQVKSNTYLEFDYKAGPLPTFAMIGLDENLQTASPGRLIKLVGGNNPPGGVVANSIFSPDLPDGYDRMKINIGSHYQINAKHLVLVNDDVDLADPGQGESWFRNIRVYDEISPNTPDPATLKEVQFDLENTVPQMINNQGSDLGLRFHDFTGDGRTDLIYRIFRNKDGAGGNNVALDIYGQTMINTPAGFETFPITTQQNLITGIKGNATDAPWARRADIPAVPVDIDGDGKLDFSYPKNVYYTGTSSFGHGHGFMTWTPAGWVDRPTLAMPFKSQSNVNYHRFNHFQFADLNGDSAQDLLVHINTGALLDSAGNVVSTTGSAWMNRHATGPGWVRDDLMALPKPLKIVGVSNGELGRRVFDANSDGLPDFVESSSVNPKEVWLNTGSGFVKRTDTKYNLPIYLTNGNGDDVGARLVDLNGDGLTDAIKDMVAYGTSFPTAVHLNTGDGWQQVADGGGIISPDCWNLPGLSFTQFDKYEEDNPGQSSMADVNADGLVDLVVARWDENKRIIFNTGMTWWESDSGPYWADNSAVTASKYYMPAPIFRTPAGASNGKAVGSFADINGDGVVDFISDMDLPQPRVWINQCTPEMIKAVTDGFDARLEIEYTNLNDPAPISNSGGKPAYTPTTDALPPGHSPVIHGGMVVTRLKESDGFGGFRATRRHYGDLRFDRNNEASLGFGRVEVYDEHFQAGGGYINRGCTIVKMRRDYPFAGSPESVEKLVNVTGPIAEQSYVPLGMRPVSLETSTYGTLPGTAGIGGTVKRPVRTSSIATKFDLGGAVLSQVTTSEPVGNYDSHGFLRRSTLTALDGSSTITENVYSHAVDSTHWWLGRQRSSKVTKTNAVGATKIKEVGFAYDLGTGVLVKEVVEPTSIPDWGTEPALDSYDPVPDSPSGNSPGGVTTVYGHDDFGNVSSTSVTGWVNGSDGAVKLDVQQTRTTGVGFDADGRFPTSGTSSLGTVGYGYDFQRALLTSSTDVNGRVTTFAHDGFGTKIATYLPGGAWSAEITKSYSTLPEHRNMMLPAKVRAQLAASPGLPEPILKWSRSGQAAGAPVETAYFDVLGREVVKEKVAYLGSSLGFASQYVVTRYDERGRKCMSSNPFQLSDSLVHWTVITYDILDRPMLTTYPDNTSDGIDLAVDGSDAIKVETINGQPASFTRIRNKGGNKLIRWTDQHGRLIKSTDPSGQITEFAYDPDGRTTSVDISPAGGTAVNQILTGYNVFGHKTSVKDLSAGTSSITYNGFGEIEFVTNPRGDVTETRHDSLGRVTHSTSLEGAFSTIYVGTGPGRGEPDTISGPGGYQEKFTYGSNDHDFGLPVLTSKRLSSIQIPYYSSVSYNVFGLVMSETDAGGVQVVHDYHSQYGSFKVMSRLAGARTSKLSEVNSVVTTNDRIKTTEHLPHGIERTVENDSRNGRVMKILTTRLGTVLQEHIYGWDPNGNLLSRTDAKIQKTENFGYDTLDRLTSSQVVGQAAVGYSYDLKGNLTGKGALNTHTYSDYRVTSAAIKGFSRSYSYDAAGYVLADGKRTFQWASSGQLKEVYQESAPALDTLAATGNFAPGIVGINPWALHNSSRVRATFDFDAEGTRSQQTLVRIFLDNSEASCVTRYLGTYEREDFTTRTATGSAIPVRTVHRHLLGSALLTEECPGLTPRGTTASKVRLGVVLTDHLGSTELVVRAEWDHQTATWKVDEGEPEAERQSFNAWGERRSAGTWADTRVSHESPLSTSATDYRRGFTGHEMLDDFGLVHMNGRIYDPELGRFLSPDPYVQLPEYSQNFNRYSYVLNNPLSLTDSTGHKVDGVWAIVISVVVTAISWGAATAIVGCMGGVFTTASGLNFTGQVLTGVIAGGMSGGLNAAITGGDPAKGALNGAITAGVGQGLGSMGAGLVRMGLQATAAGAANAAIGGKFEDGFMNSLKFQFVAGLAKSFSTFAYSHFTGEHYDGMANVSRGDEAMPLNKAGYDIQRNAEKYGDDAPQSKLLEAVYIPKGWRFDRYYHKGNLNYAIFSNEAKGIRLMSMVGTQNTGGFWKGDWGDDLRQAFGFKVPQYMDAMRHAQAELMAASSAGQTFVLTGHSLGGGLAAAASGVTGAPALVFNAAGVNPKTFEHYGQPLAAPSGSNVVHYMVNGEILNLLQIGTGGLTPQVTASRNYGFVPSGPWGIKNILLLPIELHRPPSSLLATRQR